MFTSSDTFNEMFFSGTTDTNRKDARPRMDSKSNEIGEFRSDLGESFATNTTPLHVANAFSAVRYAQSEDAPSNSISESGNDSAPLYSSLEACAFAFFGAENVTVEFASAVVVDSSIRYDPTQTIASITGLYSVSLTYSDNEKTNPLITLDCHFGTGLVFQPTMQLLALNHSVRFPEIISRTISTTVYTARLSLHRCFQPSAITY